MMHECKIRPCFSFIGLLASLFVLGTALRPDACLAQTEFGKYRMVLRSGGRVDGPSGKIRDGVLTAKKASGEAIEVPASDIRILETQSGSNAAKGFALGAVAGGLLLAVAILQVSAEENAEVDGSKVVPVGAVLILGGGALGAVIGGGSAHWKEVPLDDAQSHTAVPISFGMAWSFSF